MVGFEPTAPRFQGEYSNQTELHPDRNDVAGFSPTPLGFSATYSV